jgi:hypothetical protein
MATNPPPQADAADPTSHDPRRRRAILIAAGIAVMAIIASVNGLNGAQPQLAPAFDASQGTVRWIINSYPITLAAVLPPLGAVADRRGRRSVLLAGLIVFGPAGAAAGGGPVARGHARRTPGPRRGWCDDHAGHPRGHHLDLPGAERSRAIGVWTSRNWPHVGGV